MTQQPEQPEQPAPAITYADAGVDTAAGDRAVALMKDAVASTMTPAVVGGVGGFAGLVDVSTLRDYRRPLLATSTDGVGTKVAIAQALDIHDTIGQDLVGMVVDDIVVVGARPLLMTDYIACGHVVPERIADIVRGIAQACAAIPVRRVPTAYRGRRRDQADDAECTVPPGSITRPDLASGSPLGSTT